MRTSIATNLATAVLHQLDEQHRTQHWLAQQVGTTDKARTDHFDGEA